MGVLRRSVLLVAARWGLVFQVLFNAGYPAEAGGAAAIAL